MYTDPVRIALLILAAALLAQAQPESVVVDTDCAFFSDDGAALVMLLQRPRQVELLGLTVVPGNLWPRQGAEYMFHVLRLMKHPEIPLYVGAQAPLLHTRAM